MVKEQLRLNNIIEEKDRRIKSQDVQIIRLKHVIELQKSQVAARKPCACEINTKMENVIPSNLYSNNRENTLSLRRQPKFTKGSERPTSVSKIREHSHRLVPLGSTFCRQNLLSRLKTPPNTRWQCSQLERLQ